MSPAGRERGGGGGGAGATTGRLIVVNVKDYGAIGDGVTDDAVAIAAAAGDAGGAILFFPPGTFLTSQALTRSSFASDKITVWGAGVGISKIQQAATGHRLFDIDANSSSGSYAHFRGLTCVGTWLANQSMGLDADRHFAIDGFERVLFEDIESLYCRQMSISATDCGEVVARSCRVRYSARDAFNFTSSRRVIVVGNHVMGCGDDAIAVHNSTSAATKNPPTEGHIVADNFIEDSYGIKCLGAVKLKVTGNTIARPKGYGVYVGVDTPEGENDVTDVIVADNTITDVINSSVFGGGTVREGIFVGNSATSFAAPVVPTTPTITEPDTLGYLSNDAAQNAGGQRIKIHGNIVAITLPPVATYSTWGFGQAFTAAGFTNPDLSSAFQFIARGVSLNGALLSVEIADNTFNGMQTCIVIANPMTYIGELEIRGNIMKRYSNHGVLLETSSVMRGVVRIKGNWFNGDPLFESAHRTSVPPVNGRWSNASQQPTAFDLVNFEAVEVDGNTFENLNQVMHSDSDTRVHWGANTYIFQPDASTTLASLSNNNNRGIRVPHGLETPFARYIDRDSDPTSATYGQIRSTDTSRLLASSALPTAGYYLTGQFVRCLSPSVDTQTIGGSTPQYVVIGWVRMTTGNAHVLNTDWRELRALTGN